MNGSLKAILPQELSKFLGHGDTALLAIFELEDIVAVLRR